MRLFEFVSDIEDDIVLILRNQKGTSDSADSSGKIGYAALNNLLKNIGYGNVKYDENTFTDLYDKNPQIQELVSDYDKNGITLSTSKQPEEKTDKFQVGNSQSVKSMAARSNPYK